MHLSGYFKYHRYNAKPLVHMLFSVLTMLKTNCPVILTINVSFFQLNHTFFSAGVPFCGNFYTDILAWQLFQWLCIFSLKNLTRRYFNWIWTNAILLSVVLFCTYAGRIVDITFTNIFDDAYVADCNLATESTVWSVDTLFSLTQALE